MCGAVVRAKRPASPVPSSNAASKPRKATKKPPPQDSPPPTHPSGVVVDVLGTNRSDRGCSCEEHPDGCGTAVLMGDVIVRVRKEQILVESGFLGQQGRMREETALTVNWVSDGIDRCRVGFLPKAYVPHAKMWDGALCQVVYVGSADNPSSIVRQKFHHCCGYARLGVISVLDGEIKVFDDKYEAMMD